MDDLLSFLGIMAALSASSQAITQQMKKRIVFLHLQAKAKPDENVFDFLYEEALRRANLHVLAGVNGTVLAALVQVHPLQMLKLHPIWAQSPPIVANSLDYLSAGVIVAYGGPFFHDLLGVLRAYKTQTKAMAPVVMTGKST